MQEDLFNSKGFVTGCIVTLNHWMKGIGMTTSSYLLRLDGLSDPQGQIKANDLRKVLESLVLSAERITRLLATGEGIASGAKPAWLENSVDFTITGLKAGSTVLEIEAPLLMEAAKDQFSQKDLLRHIPADDDTALDLVASAIEETRMVDGSSDLYDSSVLESLLSFEKATRNPDVTIELVPKNRTRSGFVLSKTSYSQIAERKKELPEPRAFVVTGNLDEIKHSAGRFCLNLPMGQRLWGKIHHEFLSEESLRPLWGTNVTVEGLVHFKANGQARLIVARKLSPQTEGDEIFAELPSVERIYNQSEMFNDLGSHKDKIDPMALWGTWPGNEPIEELLAELD